MGTYSIELHRYPRESNAGFTSVVPLGDDIDGGKPYPEGVPIDIATASLKVGEIEETKEIDKKALNAAFKLELEAGEQKLRTVLRDVDEKEVGAYYVYVQKI